MARRSWMRWDLDFDTDPKIMQLRDSEFRLFIELVAWSVKHETDGALPRSALLAKGKGRRKFGQTVAHMTRVGLLTVQGSDRDSAEIAHGSDADSAEIAQTYHIAAFHKWQEGKDKPAGQGTGEGSASRAGVRAQAGGRVGVRSEQIRTESKDAQAHEESKPMAALIDGVLHTFNGSGQWEELRDADNGRH